MISFTTYSDGKIPRARNVFYEPWQKEIEDILKKQGIECVVIKYRSD